MKPQQAYNCVGTHSIILPNPPVVAGTASIAGNVESQGRFGDEFDLILSDDLWEQDSWEKAEAKMFEHAVRLAVSKTNFHEEDISCLIGGDLLNQLVSSNYAARQLGVPFLGLYGACSTMAESLLVASMLMSGGFISLAACTVSSHFSAAERQYRNPLELGSQRPLTAQRTVTGAGCTLIAMQPENSGVHIRITGGTIGRVIDLGINDANNMGAAMAPAAADTIATHLQDTGRSVDDYDLIVTGDLGIYGQQLARELCEKENIQLGETFFDCGEQMFYEEQDAHAGGSGCGCSAVVLNSYLLNRMMEGEYKRILFVATGALMSPDIMQQGETIPGVAHAVVLERREA